MDQLRVIVNGVVQGIKDSVTGTIRVINLDRVQGIAIEKMKQADTTLSKRRNANRPNVIKREEPRIMHRMFQCCMLNGGVFWISIIVFNYLILPSLQLLTNLLFVSSSLGANTIWSLINPVLSYTFGALWVIPLFVLSKLVNNFWFQDIADTAFRHSRGRPRPLPNISKFIADTLFSMLIQALFLLQGMLVTLLPIAEIGILVSWIHICLLYSLYAFEYKWFNMGWELHKRLSFIENNWPYFLGFGLPLAVLTALPSSYIISGCVFSILFPLFIISGNEAQPVLGCGNLRIQLFSPVVWVSNVAFRHTMKMSGAKLPDKKTVK